MTFNDWWKANSKRLHGENPWREELAREVWEAAIMEADNRGWAKCSIEIDKILAKYKKENPNEI